MKHGRSLIKHGSHHVSQKDSFALEYQAPLLFILPTSKLLCRMRNVVDNIQTISVEATPWFGESHLKSSLCHWVKYGSM